MSNKWCNHSFRFIPIAMNFLDIIFENSSILPPTIQISWIITGKSAARGQGCTPPSVNLEASDFWTTFQKKNSLNLLESFEQNFKRATMLCQPFDGVPKRLCVRRKPFGLPKNSPKPSSFYARIMRIEYFSTFQRSHFHCEF